MNNTLFNIDLNYLFLIEPQLMDFIVSLFIVVLGIITILIIITIKEYSNDKLIKNSLMLKNIYYLTYILLFIYLGFCLYSAFILLNSYFQALTPLLAILITIIYQNYQKKKEEIIFKKVLKNYINEYVKEAVKELEKYNDCELSGMEKYLHESRKFYYVLDPFIDEVRSNKDNESLFDFFNTSFKNNYFYLFDLINHVTPRRHFRVSPPKSIYYDEENRFTNLYNLIWLLIEDQKGLVKVFNTHFDRFMKDENLFQAYEDYRVYPLGDSLTKDYEESIKLMENIISKTEEYLQKW